MIDADRVVDTALRVGLADVEVDLVREVPPASKIDRDFVLFSELPGTSAWPGEVEFVSYVIEAWVATGPAATRLTRAKGLGARARAALWEAQGQRLTEAGVINRMGGSRPRPQLTPSGLEGVFRVVGTYDLTLRPTARIV